MNICNFIGTGRNNAVDRFQLMELTGLPDRRVRKLIQEARERGEIIINAQDGRGYYKSDDLGELEKQYNANHRRAMSVLRQQKYLKQKIREAAAKEGGQVFFHEDSFVFKVDDGVSTSG